MFNPNAKISSPSMPNTSPPQTHHFQNSISTQNQYKPTKNLDSPTKLPLRSQDPPSAKMQTKNLITSFPANFHKKWKIINRPPSEQPGSRQNIKEHPNLSSTTHQTKAPPRNCPQQN